MIEDMLEIQEKILWRGKPSHFLYAFGHILPYIIAIAWGAFDFAFIKAFLSSSTEGFSDINFGSIKGIPIFFIAFFLLHLTPVWAAIFGFIYRYFTWYKMEYVITDRQIYFVGGLFGNNIKNLKYNENTNMEVKIGIFEKLLHRGSIEFLSLEDVSKYKFFKNYYFSQNRLVSVEEPYEVYRILKK